MQGFLIDILRNQDQLISRWQDNGHRQNEIITELHASTMELRASNAELRVSNAELRASNERQNRLFDDILKRKRGEDPGES